PLEASATNFMSSSVLTRAAIPLRRRGWSSTVRIRIRLGSMLMSFDSSERASTGSDPTPFGRRPRQERPVELLSRRPPGSKRPVSRPFAALALEHLASPSVRDVCLSPAPAGPCPFHHRAHATEVGLRRTGSQPRYDAPVSAGKHSAALRARCDRLHPG